MNCTRIGFIHTNGFSLGSHQVLEAFENLAETLSSFSSGEFNIFVVNSGGEYDQADFLGLEAQDEDNSRTMVVFNTAENIVLKKTEYGRKWGPTVLAPFAKVTLADGNDFADGTIIAREFVSDGSAQQLHGNFYVGPLCPVDDDLTI